MFDTEYHIIAEVSTMKLYHGSTVQVKKPEIRVGVSLLDFGEGFYTTTSFAQAERWSRIKMRRENVSCGYVSVYEFDLESAKDRLKLRRFETADEAWLHFVVRNRRGERNDDDTDMYIGPVADDNVYQSVRFFETGILSAEETVRRLKTEVLHDQWTFHTQKSLLYCKYLECVEVRRLE